MKNNDRKIKSKRSKGKFQMDFEKVMAKIDNKAPRLDPEAYLKSRKTLSDSTRIKMMDKENLDLLKRLNIVNRLGGKVDSSIPKGKSYKSKLLSEAKANNRVIKRENKKLLKEILSTQATYSTAEYLRDWKRIEENIAHAAKYPLIWKNEKYYAEDTFFPPELKLSLKLKRPRCFFDIELLESKQYLGRIVFELYDDFAPITCANFLAFCKGLNENEGGFSYKGTSFHRIVPKYWCQGGDVTKFNGTGGTSIYGDTFKDENFTLPHRGPGVLSTSNHGPDTNDSKFNITFNSLPTMDGKRVVFGKIIQGLSNLYKIEELGCRSGKPIKQVTVSKCGLLQNK